MPTKASQKLDYDLIIIGGGPSGALTAYHALMAGLRVLIVEKEVFPRVKPCAGGLTGRVLKWLPFSVAEVIEETSDHVDVAYKYSASKRLKAPATLCAFVVREKFDNLLLNKAITMGARLRNDLQLSDITEFKTHVKASFKCGASLKAKYLVGADGANSITRKLIGEGSWLHRGYAIEGLVPKSATNKAFSMQFDIGIVDGGYGWVFPKRDHYNVGLYITSKDYSISRAALDAYVKKRLGADKINDVVGFSEGFGGDRYRPKNKRVLLVGDAAGFAEPFLGEGLHYAIRSGNIAGALIARAARKNIKNIARRYRNRIWLIRLDSWVMKKLAHKYVYPKLDEVGARMERSIERPETSTKKRSRSLPFLKGTAAGKPFVSILLTFPFHRFWRVRKSETEIAFDKKFK